MNRDTNHLLGNIALGAAAGLAGTMVLSVVRSRSRQLLPQGAEPPLRKDPGDFMVERAERVLPRSVRRRVPESLEQGASRSLALGYGMTFGALYGALRPRGGPVLADGALLGLATWAAGYLGWLPATGLMPPVWKHEPLQAIVPAAQHALYGMAAVAAYDTLHGVRDLGATVAGEVSSTCAARRATAQR
jgi:hypothetical protein